MRLKNYNRIWPFSFLFCKANKLIALSGLGPSELFDPLLNPIVSLILYLLNRIRVQAGSLSCL